MERKPVVCGKWQNQTCTARWEVTCARGEASLTVTGSGCREDVRRSRTQESPRTPLCAHLQAVVLEWVEYGEEEVVLDAPPVPLGVPGDEGYGTRDCQTTNTANGKLG